MKGEEGKEKEKGSVIVTAASLIQKKFGRSIELAGNKFAGIPASISTGSLKLNTAIGECAGYPFGSVIEVFGWEGAGKTLMLYLAIAEAQRKFPNKPCVLIDAERQFKFQAKWAAKVGVDVSKLIVIPVSTAEEAFDIMHALVLGRHEVDKKTGSVVKVHEPGNYAIIGIDSVTQLVSEVDATKGMEETRQRGAQASAIGLGLKKVSSAMARSDVNSDTILYFINQLRKNPNAMFGSPDYRTGGNALPFYDTIAFKVAKVWKSEERNENGEILSHQVKVTFEKNKAGGLPADAIVFTLMHDGTGVNNDEEMFDVALQNGILKEYEFAKKDGTTVPRYNFVDEDGEKLNPKLKDFAKRSFDVVLSENKDIEKKIKALMADGKIFVNKDSVKEEVPDSAIKAPEVNDESEAEVADVSNLQEVVETTSEEESDESIPENETKAQRNERKRKAKSLRI
jgi:recombination protein RecA